MPATEATLAEDYRQASDRLAARIRTRVTAIWTTGVDPGRVNATAPGTLDAVLDYVRTLHAAEAERAWTFYNDVRAASGLARLPADLFVRPLLNEAAVRTSLEVTGPVTLKRHAPPGATAAEATAASEKAAHALAGAAVRHVLNGGRDLVRETSARDRDAKGWHRIGDADPCEFCAMLISRGPVYKKVGKTGKSAAFQAHDHDACTAAPYFRGDGWTDEAKAYREVWDAAQAAGTSWAVAVADHKGRTS